MRENHQRRAASQWEGPSHPLLMINGRYHSIFHPPAKAGPLAEGICACALFGKYQTLSHSLFRRFKILLFLFHSNLLRFGGPWQKQAILFFVEFFRIIFVLEECLFSFVQTIFAGSRRPEIEFSSILPACVFVLWYRLAGNIVCKKSMRNAVDSKDQCVSWCGMF